MKHGSLGIFCGSKSSTHPATHSFISLASMLPLPSLSYIRNIRRNFSSGLPLEVMWITLRAIIWTKSIPEGEKIPWQKISMKGREDAYHDKVAEIDGAPVLAESSKSLRTEVLSFPSWKDLIKTSLVQKMQWKTPGNCFTLVFVTSTHCHTFEYSLEKSSGVICPLGHSFWKAV